MLSESACTATRKESSLTQTLGEYKGSFMLSESGCFAARKGSSLAPALGESKGTFTLGESACIQSKGLFRTSDSDPDTDRSDI